MSRRLKDVLTGWIVSKEIYLKHSV